MRDPIANDPFVQPDPTSASIANGTTPTSAGAVVPASSDLSGLLIAAALLAAVVLL
jgi:hypothetical protein